MVFLQHGSRFTISLVVTTTSSCLLFNPPNSSPHISKSPSYWWFLWPSNQSNWFWAMHKGSGWSTKGCQAKRRQRKLLTARGKRNHTIQHLHRATSHSWQRDATLLNRLKLKQSSVWFAQLPWSCWVNVEMYSRYQVSASLLAFWLTESVMKKLPWTNTLHNLPQWLTLHTGDDHQWCSTKIRSSGTLTPAPASSILHHSNWSNYPEP